MMSQQKRDVCVRQPTRAAVLVVLVHGDLPVENLGLDLAAESVQGDVVLHELLHLELVREVERGAKPASLCDCEPNNAAPSAELESCGRTRVSVIPTETFLHGVAAAPR